jgi:hypothetical protein
MLTAILVRFPIDLGGTLMKARLVLFVGLAALILVLVPLVLGRLSNKQAV